MNDSNYGNQPKPLTARFSIIKNNRPMPCAKPVDKIMLSPVSVYLNLEEQKPVVLSDEGQEINH
jgi:hypothetical protein